MIDKIKEGKIALLFISRNNYQSIPSLKMADLFREKSKFGVSRSTVGNSKFHGDDYKKKPWLKFWFEKYSWIKPHAREQFKAVEDKYKNSIQQKIFSWHILDGPKTLDDLKVPQ
jgi:hypothetical protein